MVLNGDWIVQRGERRIDFGGEGEGGGSSESGPAWSDREAHVLDELDNTIVC